MTFVTGQGRVHVQHPTIPTRLLCGRRRNDEAEVLSPLIASNLRLCAQCSRRSLCRRPEGNNP